MSERTVEVANAEPDVGFNLTSLKYRLILADQQCNKCNKKTKEWMIVGLCHHTVCLECVSIHSINKCLVCGVKFDPEKQASNTKKMKTAFSQIEELVFYLMAIDKGTITNIVPDTVFKQKFQNKSTINVNGILNDDNVMQDAAETDVIEQKANVRSTNISTTSIHDNLMLDADEIDVDCNELPNASDQQTYPSRNASELSLDIFDESQNNELVEEDNEQNYVEMDSRSNNELVNENTNEQSDYTDISSIYGSDIDDEVIIGTPERNKCLPMVLCHTGMDTVEEIDTIKRMARMFKIKAETNWSYRTTHLIVMLNSKGFCDPTVKFLRSMINNCCIVNYQWVQDCVSSKSLLSELDYMTLNMYGDATPVISFKVGRGEIESPMGWCKDCGIFIHDSIKDSEFQYLMLVAKSLGCVVFGRMEEFNDCKLKMRVILCKNRSNINDETQHPNDQSITRWIHDYKAVTLGFDWLIDCVIRYSFIPFSHLHQIKPVEYSLVKSANLDESLFEFNTS